jgi:hypothetical protein
MAEFIAKVVPALGGGLGILLAYRFSPRLRARAKIEPWMPYKQAAFVVLLVAALRDRTVGPPLPMRE